MIDASRKTGPCRTRALAFAWLLVLLPVCGAAQEVSTVRASPEVVTFSNGDLVLSAELYVPEGSGPFPAIVYNHGSAPGMANADAFGRLGPLFVERGWVLFAPYRRGQGLSAEAGPYIGDVVAAARAESARRSLPLILGAVLVVLVAAFVLRGRVRARSLAAVVVVTLAGGALAYHISATSAAGAALVEALETAHLSDHLAALDWLREQRFVDPNRIATGGNSFGGVLTLLAAETVDYCAAFDASGAAQSWSASGDLRRRLARAARGSRAPVLFFQAENDYSTEPSRILAGEAANAGNLSQRIVYPAFGRSAEEGHAFAWRGGALWADDVFAFLGRHCSSERVLSQEPFEVYSAFWPNLHHVLYSEAWRRRSDTADSAAAFLPEPLTAELTADERAAWDAAVAYYDRRIADRHLLFGLSGTRQAILRAGAGPPASLPDSRHREVLLAAAPVYRTHWWPAHDAANRAWIAEAMPRIAELSPEVPERLAALYRSPWFDADVRVDIVRVASREGAYTAREPRPAHITISSSEPNNRGWSAAEVVFHEASHALIDPVRRAIFAASGPDNGRDLWHAALFYTTGEVVRQSLEARGHGYRPYLYSTGLVDRAWPNFRQPLELHWQAYVDGENDLGEAARALVGAVDGSDD